ncbi:hypothetical protein GCM10009119_25740 [Algoriphagus jejuensis]|uniref:DinB family protein n=1 Tax=Algoriphagus jejuensis TaxID=419934 RepID=A0ABP3YG21_9BACT
MNTKELNQLFQRDLEKLGAELSAYTDETKLWIVDREIANSAGNLALHLLGNLRTFIGLDLGNIPYVRNRDHEFGGKGVSREELLRELEEVKSIVESSLLGLAPDRIRDMSVQTFFGYQMTIGFFLIHLYGHFNYHLGQVNYHRRLLG